MTSTSAVGSSELLRELRSLCARLPVPHPGWHPYTVLIVACRKDFQRAIDLAAESRDDSASSWYWSTGRRNRDSSLTPHPC